MADARPRKRRHEIDHVAEARSQQTTAQLDDIAVDAAEVRLHGQDAADRPHAHAAGRADPLAVVGSHRRRPDGRARQPSARRGQHLHLRPAAGRPQRRSRCRSPASAAGSIFPADRDCDDHVYCMFEFPGHGLLRSDATATRWPIRTRRSSSPIRRSTATASAATARSCSAPRAR